MAKNIITVEYLREHLRFDETGLPWWLKPGHGRQLDRPAGTIITTGKSPQTVRMIGLGGRAYYAHVLHWAWANGEWPKKGTIDHIDQNPLNNALSNLRDATRSENNMNRKIVRPGLTGASFHKPSGRWQATIKKDGKQRSLGYFKTAEEAHEAYRKAALELFGEFAHRSLRESGTPCDPVDDDAG